MHLCVPVTYHRSWHREGTLWTSGWTYPYNIFQFHSFSHPLKCVQYMYKIGLSVVLSPLSNCRQVGLWVSSQRESRNWVCECEKSTGQSIRSLGFYPSPATTELCDLGSSFILPWALKYPSIEWGLEEISTVLSFLHIHFSGTKCVDCPGSSQKPSVPRD